MTLTRESSSHIPYFFYNAGLKCSLEIGKGIAVRSRLGSTHLYLLGHLTDPYTSGFFAEYMGGAVWYLS